jgi:hypothetical protein
MVVTLTAGLSALNSVNSLYEMVRDIRDSNDPEKLRASAGQMFELAFAAREQVAILQEERNAAVIELAALEAEVEKMKRFDQQVENYTRERTHSGATIYRENGSAGPEGHSPYFCPHCFSNKELQIMNPAAGANTMIHTFEHKCPRCKTMIPLPKLRR